MGVSRASLSYVSKKDTKDWALKVRIEETLRGHPSYGSRRLADALRANRKQMQRVMRKYGIRPYRRRGRRYRKSKTKHTFPNLLLAAGPSYPNHVWATDFTELSFRGKSVFVSTIIDLFTRRLMGIHVAVRRGAPLTVQTLENALFHHTSPVIFHSDNGKEYEAKIFVNILRASGTAISRSKPGCPWENGYQESFYDEFKVDLGDPDRFDTLGELVAEIYRTLWEYNYTRIHSALRMPPAVFAEKMAA